MTSLEDLAFGDAPSAAEAGFIEASVCFAQTSASDVVEKDFESAFAGSPSPALLARAVCDNCTCEISTGKQTCEACTSKNGEGCIKLVSGRPGGGFRDPQKYDFEF